MHKVHTIPFARISIELRKQINHQEELIKQSPYLINTREIKKHILENSLKKNL